MEEGLMRESGRQRGRARAGPGREGGRSRDGTPLFGPPNSDDELSRSSTGLGATGDSERDSGRDSSDDAAGFVCPRLRRLDSKAALGPNAPPAALQPRGPVPLVNGRPVFLSLLRQPELQHRARYMSEGSRGAVKGRYGKSHPTVQLSGYNRATRLEVYCGTGSGAVGPHALYRAIPVVGKGGAGLTTPCSEVLSPDGLHCVQLTLRPDHKMTAVLDCVGVLKICGHEMKRRLPKTGRNSSVRLVLRAYVPDERLGRDVVVQCLSEPISCVQQLGFPEVQKLSRSSDSLKGGSELFILGKNFDKNTKVIFREWDAEGSLVWISEARVEKRHLHQCHLVCEVPTYKSLTTSGPVDVSLTVECGQKNSHPQAFVYAPASGHSESVVAGSGGDGSGSLVEARPKISLGAPPETPATLAYGAPPAETADAWSELSRGLVWSTAQAPSHHLPRLVQTSAHLPSHLPSPQHQLPSPLSAPQLPLSHAHSQPSHQPPQPPQPHSSAGNYLSSVIQMLEEPAVSYAQPQGSGELLGQGPCATLHHLASQPLSHPMAQSLSQEPLPYPDQDFSPPSPKRHAPNNWLPNSSNL